MRGEAMAYLREVREAQQRALRARGRQGQRLAQRSHSPLGRYLAGAGKEDRTGSSSWSRGCQRRASVSPIDFLQEYYVACGVVKGAFDLNASRRRGDPVTYRRARTGRRLWRLLVLYFDEPISSWDDSTSASPRSSRSIRRRRPSPRSPTPANVLEAIKGSGSSTTGSLVSCA